MCKSLHDTYCLHTAQLFSSSTPAAVYIDLYFMKTRQNLCIDLKSFYASVECVERGLDPMTTKLVVADPSRSSNTICLAVSPAMKRAGVRNRCRMGDIPSNLDYIIAPPRMQRYIDYSAEVYRTYLHFISKDDIHVYSIDEAFMDVTDYLDLYHTDAHTLGIRIMKEIQDRLGIRATCGIGTNLYLTKIALDITAKHSPDFIGELTEESYRATLWKHRPLTDFWRIGRGLSTTLAKYAIYTMEDIAHTDEDFLYNLLGIDAELLIDHAWGREPVTISDIKSYHSKNTSLSSGQVLMRDYPFDQGRLIVKEMMDQLCLELTSKHFVTSSITLYIGYSSPKGFDSFSHGNDTNDRGYAASTTSVSTSTNASSVLVPAITELYNRIADPLRTIRRVNITCNSVTQEAFHQMDLFIDTEYNEKDVKLQQAMLELKERFGKNAVLKGMNLEDGAMTMERNRQIGGHKRGDL